MRIEIGSARWLAGEWVRNDPDSAACDVEHLGLESAVGCNMSLVQECLDRGDKRWIGINEDAMREALKEVAR